MNVKELIEGLEKLGNGVLHTNMERGSMFMDAARMLKWYDDALFEEKRKVRELTAKLEAIGWKED